jgi:SpoVK/Ycf46/Vps4 family AAA+-type ATPase
MVGVCSGGGARGTTVPQCLLSPLCFGKQLKVDMPDQEQRHAILRALLQHTAATSLPASTPVTISLEASSTSPQTDADMLDHMAAHVAGVTSGYTPRGLVRLCREAFLNSLQRYMTQHSESQTRPELQDAMRNSKITLDTDMAAALRTVKPSDVMQFDVGLPVTPWSEFHGYVCYYKNYMLNLLIFLFGIAMRM